MLLASIDAVAPRIDFVIHPNMRDSTSDAPSNLQHPLFKYEN
jgi:hypothetical protein